MPVRTERRHGMLVSSSSVEGVKMKMLGMGIPEIIIVLALYALVIFVFYLIVKKAVKNGVIEAHNQIEMSKGKSPSER